MAPRGSAKARDYDYSNVGKLGRRTGITVKEGKRDEHGMEDIDGMWSSPERSPVRENGFSDGNESSVGSDGMSMDEGNAPGPADFLSGMNGGRNSYFPPPVARSPMKTGLTGSPRRTPGLRSSQSPQREPLSSSPSDGKGLGHTKGELRQDVSPLTHRSINAPPLNHLSSARIKANKKTQEVAASFSDSDANSQSNADENANSFEHIRDDFADSFDAGNDTMLDEAEEPDENSTATPSPSILAVGLQKKGQIKIGHQPKKRARSGSSRTQLPVELDEPQEHGSSQKRKRPGRPAKNQRSISHDTEEPRLSKKFKASDKETREPKTSGHPDLDRVVEDHVNRTGPLKGRSLYILKRETPTDSSTTHTRSGRVSVRPLAYWKNERCVYGDGEAAEGERYPLSTIKEIIRTEELEPERRKPKKGRPSKKSKSGKPKDDNNSEDDEDYIDPWEKEGILHDIAYAPSGIETRDVKGSTFRFAKLLSSPFLGSGIVELPSGGVKKPKNSKKMHMVFYVCHGRVQVDISGVQFSAGKGCVFQVPRGNYYSFANTHGKDARLFFTQGCVPVEGNNSAPGSASKNDTMEEEPTPQFERPLGVGKGRPKGKQKAGGSKAS
ncbi:Cupin domain protein [Aspergillus nomiae NRRL 13137]|uniref:CENP-C homolog n=1 Tax=Aspergillus nomiae NRRL (strain ATCC 15546 / NRRL 13137 / CBS 260.88 / M93) TaxID=1509407 RepID=A0A0L1ISK4_ASPN3|nr:Cupin domain protein [Aspergillus nomiae NRRL 13137]KNG82556.1 Cupin domain protein [Aspergillus nomiae NRRL 13137]